MPTVTRPTCPWPDCGKTIKRRVKGCCPYCRKPVYYINGFASTEERPSLSVELFDHFNNLVRRKEGYGLSLPRVSKGYIKELGHAIAILKKCGGDVDLARETITQCFRHKSLSFRTRQSLQSVLWDFRLANSAAKRVIALRRADEEIVARSMARSPIEIPMPSFG